ncbi:MAG: HAD family phosphatase [Clostridiales bacterium]|nr:HAD family phosphatase [Clostridiales bacterium]
MQIDAIVTDLDDTLLNGESMLSPYTLDVMARAKARGIRLIPASGRTSFSMLRFMRQLDTGLPYIACNGGELVAPDHTVLESVDFSPEKARQIIRFLRENDFYVQCYRGEHFYYDQECDHSESYRDSSRMLGQAVGNLEAFVDFPTPKVLSVQSPEVVSRMYPLIQKAFPDVSFTISKPYFLEAQPEGVSKGAALRKLAGRLGLTPGRTLVFGDSLNDLTMLQFAENSVAMGNAREDIKQATRHVCATNAEDGVARFIDEHVLA